MKNASLTLGYIALITLITVNFLKAQPFEGKLLGRWSDSTLVGSRFYDNTYNEIWGLAVNGHEYAVIGSTWGTHFIDVTDPTKPYEAFKIAGAAQGDGIVHRDYHDYHCLLYAVSDEGNSTLQIMDISELPDKITVLYDDRSEITRAHNIFIDTSAGKLYGLSVRGKNKSAAMSIYDLTENPLKPKLLGSYHKFGDLNVGHVHDAYVRNKLAFLHCGPEGLAIVDFSNPLEPNTLGTLQTDEYPYGGYNHSGWLDDDGDYYYMADETHGYPMKVLDMRDVRFPKAINTFQGKINSPNSIPHNLIVNNHFLYVSNYYDGLQVFDITNPRTPVPYMFYSTSDEPNKKSYKGAWGVYPFLPSGNILVSDMQKGLFIIKGVDPDHNAIYNCGEITTATTKAGSSPFKIKIEDHALQIYFDNSSQNNFIKDIRIYDLSGQLLKYEMVASGSGEIRIEIPRGAHGICFLEISSDQTKTIRKIYLSH